jgi:hypothetical protein
VTAIDNIFLDRSKNDKFTIEPFHNGLSDHDALLLTLYTHSCTAIKSTKTRIGRKYCMESISNFKLNLSFESWESVFEATNGNEVDIIYNNFLNVYLRIFNNSFPQHKSIIRNKGTGWIMKGIINSCRQKRELYLLYRMSNNSVLRNYYRKYCKILANTIQLAKRLYYNKLIIQSTNKTRTAWNVIRSLTTKRHESIDDRELALKIEGNLIKNPKVLASTFNKYFSNAVEETVSQILNQNTQGLSRDSYM